MPFKGDIAINADTIAAIGDVQNNKTIDEIDAREWPLLQVSLNRMGHSEETLFQDSRALSDGNSVYHGGVGESASAIKCKNENSIAGRPGDIKYKVDLEHLGEYMNTLERRNRCKYFIFCWNWHDKTICARRR